MSKQMTPSELIAALEARGIAIPDDLVQARENETRDEAFHYLSEKMPERENEKAPARTSRVESLVNELFSLAARVSDETSFDEKTVQGRGTDKHKVHALKISTDNGHLSIVLKR